MPGRDDEGLALDATTPVGAVDATTPDARTVASGDAGATRPAHAAGAKIGRYTIAGVLGSGGMGVVYRAFDPQLGRPVALKVVRPGHNSEETRERLIREAQAMAKLAHPNVIAVHDAGSVDDEVFVAMELVDGDNLAAWLDAPHAWRDVLAMFEQAARGLAAAHAAGLVHRDFKPLNVLVGKDGRVRVLDFGLARPIAAGADAATDAAHTDTAPLSLTRTGAILGTPLYMAPEQHAGGATDARTDQFAFCVALYHALYGAYPFGGGSLPELMVSVMEGKVTVPAGKRVPAWLRRVVLRGLSVRPDARFASMEALLDEVEAGLRRRRLRAIAAIALPVVAIAAVATVLALRHDDVVPKLPPFASARPQQITFGGNAFAPSLSHDRHHLAYLIGSNFASESALVIQDLATGATRLLRATSNTRDLRWSPDDSALLTGNQFGALIAPAAGGEALQFGGCTLATWSPDGRTILQRCQDGTQWAFIDVATGERRKLDLAIPRTLSLADIDWSSRDLLLAVSTEKSSQSLWTMRPDGTDLHEIYSASGLFSLGTPRWNAAGDKIYFVRSQGAIGELTILAFDARTGRAAETDAVSLGRALGEGDGFTISADETTLITSMSSTQVDLVALSGDRRTPLTQDTEPKSVLRVSRDGRRIAFASSAGSRSRIHIVTIEGQPIATLPPRDGATTALAWSPDGRELAYTIINGGVPEVWRADIGSGRTSKLVDGAYTEVDWSPTGQIVLAPLVNHNLVVLDPTTGAQHTLLDQPSTYAFTPRVSPDGKRIVVGRNVAGTNDLWSVEIDGSNARPIYGGEALPVGWSPDGNTVYVSDPETSTEVIGVDLVTHAATIAATSPRPVLAIEPAGSGWIALLADVRSDLWAWTASDHPIALPTGAIQATAQEPPNPVPTNLEFEDGERDGIPRGWSGVRGPNPRFAVVDHAGKRAVEIAAAGRVALAQRIDATRYRGRRIALRFQVLSDGAGVRVNVVSIVGGRSVISGAQTSTARTWSKLETLADIRPNADAFEIQVMTAHGTAWVADGSLEIVP